MTFETEDPSVFSNGTWKAADGIVAGIYRQSETLQQSTATFQFAGNALPVNAPVSTPTPAPAPSGVIASVLLKTMKFSKELQATTCLKPEAVSISSTAKAASTRSDCPAVRSDYDVFFDEPTGRYNFTNLDTVEGALLTDVETVEFIASVESVFIGSGNLPPTTPAPVSPAAPSTPIDQPNSGVSIIDPQTGQTIDLSGIFASLSPEAQAVFAAGIADLNGSVTPTPAPAPTPTLCRTLLRMPMTIRAT